MAVLWLTVWSHSLCPAATTRLTRSGWAAACGPIMQKVALTSYFLRTSRTLGVHTGSGPSSMVMFRLRPGRSEACTIDVSTLTRRAAALSAESTVSALAFAVAPGWTNARIPAAVSDTAAAATTPMIPPSMPKRRRPM